MIVIRAYDVPAAPVLNHNKALPHRLGVLPRQTMANVQFILSCARYKFSSILFCLLNLISSIHESIYWVGLQELSDREEASRPDIRPSWMDQYYGRRDIHTPFLSIVLEE